jgi:hypothetical protein
MMSGGKWGMQKTRSYLDEAEWKGRQTPGPGEYRVEEAVRYLDSASSGGKFNMSKPKTYMDLQIYEKRHVPAPGSYDVRNQNPPRGGKFNMSNPKSDVDWMIARAKKVPAPGQYGAPDIPRSGGGKFSQGRPKSSLDWTIHEASKKPGPGAYDIDAGRRLTGGKFNKGQAKSEVEWVEYRAKRIPGPGQYDIERSSRYVAKNIPKFSFAGRPGPASMPEPFSRPATSFSRPPTSFSRPQKVRGSVSGAGTGAVEREVIGSPDGTVSPERSAESLMSPTRLALRQETIQRTRKSEKAFQDRLSRAYSKSVMVRKQKETIGFGRTFFI